jgi:hypothetical protein
LKDFQIVGVQFPKPTPQVPEVAAASHVLAATLLYPADIRFCWRSSQGGITVQIEHILSA